MTPTTYLLRALDANGVEGFYTGRAGQGFVGTLADAWTYEVLASARRQAGQFNGFTELHGWRFNVVEQTAEGFGPVGGC